MNLISGFKINKNISIFYGWKQEDEDWVLLKLKEGLGIAFFSFLRLLYQIV